MGNQQGGFSYDTKGNIEFRKDMVVAPYVSEGSWRDPAKYSFLDGRYADLNNVNALQTNLNTAQADIAGIRAEISSMRTTYNDNFATIASSVSGV